jgi:hypothetical protein
MSDEDIVIQAKSILAAGPMTEARLLDELGLHDETPLLGNDSGVWFTMDGRVALEETLFEGLTLTHRVNDDEASIDSVIMGADVAPVLALFATDKTVALPKGAKAGTLVAITHTGDDAAIRIIQEDDLSNGQSEADALRHHFQQSQGSRTSCHIENLTVDLRVADPRLFSAPVPPLSELAPTVGMTTRGRDIGMDGEPWDEWPNELGKRRFAQLADDMEFEDHCEAAFEDVLDEWARLEPDATRVGHQLEHSNVAIALTNWSYDPESNRQWLRRFAESIPPTHRLASIRSYFLGSLAAFDLELDTAEQLLAEATASSVLSVTAAAAETLGRIASIRGDAATAYRLLRQAGVDDEEAQLLARIFSPTTGRNEPCPCGSGKKFKHCHQGSMELTPPQRMKWIVVRIGRDLAQDDTYAIERTITDALGDLSLQAIETIAQDPLTNDIVFFEGGYAQAFLDRYRSEMKQEDLDMLERILEAPRRVLPVADVEPLHLVVDGTNQRAVILDATEKPNPGNHLFGRFVEIDNILISVGLIMELEPDSAAEFREFLDVTPRPDSNTLLQWLFADE